jgi:hypothetical protein
MKLKTITKVGALIAALALTSAANAAYINGGISFTGDYTSDVPNNLNTSTLITFGVVTTTSTSGDFLADVGNGVVVTTPVSININPNDNPPAGNIWSVGGFSLALTSLVEFANSANALVLNGTGLISSTNPAYTPTPGDWVATFNRAGGGPNATFSFSASSGTNAPVPEGGTTVALLGFALLGLHGVRRKLVKR